MNRRPRCITVITALLLAACSSPASRIDAQKSAYNSYPPEVQSKISAGQVDVGFTPEQARLALGEPSRKFTRTTEKGASEVWAYTKSSPVFSIGLGGGSFGRGFGGGGGISTSTGGEDPQDRLRLVFENGRVASIEQTVK